MHAPATAARPGSGCHRLRRLRAVLLGLAVALVVAQALGAAHRASHEPVEPSTCAVCAVSCQPLALGSPASPLPCCGLVAFELDDTVPSWSRASRAGASPRAPPATAAPTPS